jgi:two-component system phosphate regulon sensor histidine kinase PhoR
MAEPRTREARDLARRAEAWWIVAAVVVPAAVAMVSWAGAGVAVVLLVGFTVARRAAVGPELAALDELVAALESAQPVPEALPGGAGRVAAVFQEATTSATAEIERLQTELARAGELLNAAPDGVVVVGADGRVELVNLAARRLLTVRRGPEGMLPIEAFPVAEVQEVVDMTLDGKASGVLRAPRGELHLDVEAHAVAGGVMVMVRDATDTWEAERARTEFVANISHELRTPIAAIMGYAETLEGEPAVGSGDAKMMVDAILRGSRRLSRLFDDVLKLHRIESRRHALPREPVRVQPVLEEAVALAAERGRSSGLTVTLECGPDVVAHTSREALLTIVSNLVSNACKYNAAGGSVWVRAVPQGDGVVVEVEDTGIGIPRSHQDRIFERFYRVDEGRGRVSGAGVGLAIVKHFAQAVGGQVSVRSTEGRGSTFRLSLPGPGGAPRPTTWDVTL